jgi:hypothetical protein
MDGDHGIVAIRQAACATVLPFERHASLRSCLEQVAFQTGYGTGWMMAPWWLRPDDQGPRRHLAVHEPIDHRDLSLVEVLASAIQQRGERRARAC